MELPVLDEKKVLFILEKFLQDKLKDSALTGYVIGISGGIDSALSATIAVRAVGREKVLGLMMPYSNSSINSSNDAIKMIEWLGVTGTTIDISPMVNAYFKEGSSVEPVRKGNKMARERMSILFDKAHELKRLVLGTSNRTEICLGYGTWYGDIASSVNPIGSLYKTQVRQMAKYCGVPDSIINKIPTADLWLGQTDEGELGLEYAKVDRLLYMVIELGIADRKKLNDAGFENAFIDRAVSLVNYFYFKRHLPQIPDLGLRPIPDKILIV